MQRITIVAALAGVSSACAPERGAIEQFGAMRPVMREGSTQARVGVCDAAARESRFGIGALEGLSGEITISGGEVWVTRVVDGKPVSTGPACSAGDRATLLSVGTIPEPATAPLDAALSGTALEDAIRRAAGEHGSAPFMFEIDATATMLRAHVIAGTCAHADPNSNALRISIDEPLEVRIVGLYADGSAGTLTHHGTNVHMHAIFTYRGARMTAHIDSISIAPGGRATVPGPARTSH